jgi:hypothetical protein
MDATAAASFVDKVMVGYWIVVVVSAQKQAKACIIIILKSSKK